MTRNPKIKNPKKSRQQSTGNGERLADLAYSFIHNGDVHAEIPLVTGIREALAQGNRDAITMAVMALMIKDQDIAMEFVGICIRHACFRFEDQYPSFSHVLGIPIAEFEPITFAQSQLRQLREVIVASGLACPAADIHFHPTTVDLENLVTAHPCEIASLHDQIPAHKALPSHLIKKLNELEDPDDRLQVLLMVIAVPKDQETCLDLESFDTERQAAFAQLLSQLLFGGQTVVVPPDMLSDIISGDTDEEDGQADLEQEFSDALMHAIAELGTSDLEASIEEPDEKSLLITLCESPETCWNIQVEYDEADWSRSDAFMMVYDVMKDAGIVAILLNDAEDGAEIVDERPPEGVVRH